MSKVFDMEMARYGTYDKMQLLSVIEHLRENEECIHMFLDDQKIVREGEGGKFSIVGRIKRLMRQIK